MRILFAVLFLFATGCATKDKKSEPEIPVVTAGKIDGEQLFKNNCSNCHKPGKDFTGPALKGSLARWGDKKAMYAFIRNPSKLINENAYARQLDEKWKGVMMTSFTLSDAEIDAIMDYCENFVSPTAASIVVVD